MNSHGITPAKVTIGAGRRRSLRLAMPIIRLGWFLPGRRNSGWPDWPCRSQGQGIGGQLLLAAGRRCLLASAEVGGVVIVIDAKNQRVAGWYASYGAMPLLDAPLTLLLPLATIVAALRKT